MCELPHLKNFASWISSVVGRLVLKRKYEWVTVCDIYMTVMWLVSPGYFHLSYFSYFILIHINKDNISIKMCVFLHKHESAHNAGLNVLSAENLLLTDRSWWWAPLRPVHYCFHPVLCALVWAQTCSISSINYTCGTGKRNTSKNIFLVFFLSRVSLTSWYRYHTLYSTLIQCSSKFIYHQVGGTKKHSFKTM